MIKVKFFDKLDLVQQWLIENQKIYIISTNLSCSTGEYGTIWYYSILYQTRENE